MTTPDDGARRDDAPEVGPLPPTEDRGTLDSDELAARLDVDPDRDDVKG